MSDERAAEPPPGSPGQRALGAMESAVRRARETARAGATPIGPAPYRPVPHDPGAVGAQPSRSGRPPGRSERWLIGSVAVVAALVVAAAIALVVSVSTGPSALGPTAAGTSTVPSPPRPASPGARSGGGHGTTTSTTLAGATGGPPVISSLSPASGAAGQAIVVAGANFLSSSGQIVATFNGQVAPTSCPAQNTCNVTVPASPSPSAQVAITTAGGTSNPVTFTYG
jgi:hypothetical protein